MPFPVTVPATVVWPASGLLTEALFASESVAPLATVTPVVFAWLAISASVPALMVVAPEYVFEPDSVSEFVPSFATPSALAPPLGLAMLLA